ncbi:hypothetical protein COTS27_01324 [Spirochaetota bacterium]|nr:hypothetical protein COTS27_01324 [Spirochaetota bacterium]
MGIVLAKTLGELKKTPWRSRSVRVELRENLIAKMKNGEPLFPNIKGYEKSVEVQLVNAILSLHDFILLGLRGQGKTKIIRLLSHFLDEHVPVLAGTSLNEDPYAPISPLGRRLVKEAGVETPITWLTREERFKEKLATPDVSIADLIGDIDPIKAAREKLDISNEEVIHWGLIPRSNRGIFAINELPDLQPRIQVGLFNILEERDIQVRGFPLRVPLDILLVFSANPEDYTNRGRIITPLKDRIDSQIITHYPKTIATARAITLQEAQFNQTDFTIVDILYDLIERVTFCARKSEHVDQMSGVSQRLSISLLESVLASALQRGIKQGQSAPYHVRLMDIYGGLTAITGKIELLEERNHEELLNVSLSLIGEAIKEIFSEIFPALMYKKGKKQQRQRADDDHNINTAYAPIIDFFKAGNRLRIDDGLSDSAYLTELNKVPTLKKLALKHVPTKQVVSFYMELVLEGLYYHSFINREIKEGYVTYLDIYSTILKGLV